MTDTKTDRPTEHLVDELCSPFANFLPKRSREDLTMAHNLDVPDVCLVMSGWKPEAWNLESRDLPFPLLSLCPEAPEFFAKAAHFSPRDLRRIVEILRLDPETEPVNIYRALIKRSQDAPWVWSVAEIYAALAREGNTKRAPNLKQFQRLGKNLGKLPLSRLSLSCHPELHHRVGELLDTRVSADVAVAAFCEYAARSLDLVREEMDFTEAYSFGEITLRFATNKERIEALLGAPDDVEDWWSVSMKLVNLDEVYPEVVSELFQQFIAAALLENAASMDETSSPSEFSLLARLATIGERRALELIASRNDTVSEFLSGLGVDTGPDGLSASLAERLTILLTPERMEVLARHKAKAANLKAEMSSIRSRIAAATEEDDFEQLAELSATAKRLKVDIQAEDDRKVRLQRAIDALRSGGTEEITSALVDMNQDFPGEEWHGDASDGLDDDNLELKDTFGAPTETNENDDEESREADLDADEGDASEPNSQSVPVDAKVTPAPADAPAEPGADLVVATFADDEAEMATTDIPDDEAAETTAWTEQANDLAVDSPDGTTGQVDEKEASSTTAETDPDEVETEVPVWVEAQAAPAPVSGSVLADLVDRDLLGIAAEAAEIFERDGLAWPIEAVALKAAAASRAPHREYGHDMQRFQAIVSRLPAARLDDLGSALVIGALIRPAVLESSFGFRQTLPDYCRGVIGTHLQESIDAIAALDYDFPPSADELARLSGIQHAPQKARIARQLAEWCEAFSQKKSRWPFATMFMHHVVSEAGLIGRASAAISAGLPEAKALARRAIEELKTQNDIEDRSIEFAADSGRHSVQIYPKGLEYLAQKFDEPLGLLDRWMKAVEREGSRSQQSEDRARTTIRTLRSRLGKAATGLREDVSKAPDGLEAAVMRWVIQQIRDLEQVLEGGDAGAFATLEDALVAERDLLPASIRDALGQDRVDSVTLAATLTETRVPEPIEAFQRACDEGAFDTAARLATRFAFDDQRDLDSAMRSFSETWRAEVSQRERRLQTIAKVDYTNQDEIGRQTSWCKITLERLKSIHDGSEVHDLADISEYIHNLDAEIAAFEMSIREDQTGRISRYRNEQNAEDADALLAEIDDLTIEAIEDRIAQLRDGRSAASFDIDLSGLVPEFTPDFLSFAASADWPRSSMAFHLAMESDGPLHVDEDRRRAGAAFISLFLDAIPSRSRKAPDAPKLRELFEEIGFENVKVHDLKGISRANAWTGNMSGKIRSDGSWFLPPTFGSKALAGYRLVIGGPDALPENIVKALTADTPSIIILSGVADIPRRQELAERLRGGAYPALLIDEALIAFAAARRETRARSIFECGLPYGRVEPYITDAGQLPPEMFYGRTEEIRKIMSRTADGCLVYGGRQLGKSALLGHVARIYHSPEDDRIVVRREVKSLGNSEPTSAIWNHITSMLGPEVIKPSSRSAADIARDLRAWTHERPKGQIICLFDEADHFMDADTRDDYPELSRLKELMEDTGRAFKVVFAGLHNVQRIRKQPNSPLAHLGSPVCIGPLNRSEDDRRAAYDLVIQPMRAAGFRFESQKAVEDILAWANYYPSLVQEYAKGLIATNHGVGSGKSYSLPGDGPLWVIPTSDLFEHRGFAQIASRVREKFHFTLDLDPRYALVAYTLARLSVEGEEQKALVTGYLPEDLLEEAKHFWPKHSQVPSPASFEPLLDELFDLGVLGRQAPANTRRYRYVLRTREVAAMLGSADDIAHALDAIEHKDPTVAYDRSIHRRRYATGAQSSSHGWAYAPLSDIQIERLFDRDSDPIHIICGLDLLDLSRTETALRRISESGRLPNAPETGVSILSANTTRDMRKMIEKSAPQDRSMSLLFYTPSTGQEAAQVLAFAEKQPNVLNRVIRPVLLLDAADNEMRGLAIRRGSQSQFLAPWGAEMIRVHLSQCEWPELDTPDLRSAILAAIGGLPGPTLKLIEAMHLSDNPLETAREWEPGVKLPEHLRAGVLGRSMSILMMDDGGDYETLNELMIEEIGQDLVSIGPDLIATGLVSEWRPKAGRVRSSALGQFISTHLQD